MPSPRFAVFVPNLEEGPAQRALVALANGLRRRGFAVDVVAPMGGGALRAGLDPAIGQIDLAKRHTATSALALARILAERQPAALVAAGATANVVALAAAILARQGTPVVIAENGEAAGGLVDALRRRLYPRAAAIIDGFDDGRLGDAVASLVAQGVDGVQQ
ncbi:glycosyltransferase [Azospirillum soli]|uniref:glycosyltransferase n=1 Tax=Azospirillum soli TaxID=1304799 RepID=UPI001AE88840|nr:glycosyltransferase [Azospirillum soli]MBP2314537.1 hypothetical protein [Azospirillum soli]